MAETAQEKIPSLAEQWSLEDKEEKSDQSEAPVEKTTGDGKPADATSEEAVLEKTDETAVAEENSETSVQEQTESQEAAEEKSVIKLETTPEDFHFPKPADATSEEAVPEKTDENPVADEPSPVAEENSEPPEQEETESQEATEEKPMIKLETAPADFRFPTTNQTRHCFTRYIEYHKCIAAKGEGAPDCDKFAKYYRSLCPSEWIERWNEQRANGTFPGPL
ncbi:cytochrome c oxidase subunit 6b-1-like [Phoenix dactylifera]|uniref:Cytochrome c oxidase subunit 6b-1-like n=1 Tax=Phoenix dactylifera TaxID=42345 RepID=A0A8B7BNH4_PHODC|nr:cytochrome c oxidase subunit 6b-1-like [Phoenix dactylifera]